MRTSSIEMGDPRFENHASVDFIQGNHEIQTLPSCATNQAFTKSIQIWGSRRQFDGLDAGGRKNAQKLLRIQRISIVDQITLSREETIHGVRQIPGNLAHP